eukprot:1146254-Pelagomonas_calceolata.AAC.2
MAACFWLQLRIAPEMSSQAVTVGKDGFVVLLAHSLHQLRETRRIDLCVSAKRQVSGYPDLQHPAANCGFINCRHPQVD